MSFWRGRGARAPMRRARTGANTLVALMFLQFWLAMTSLNELQIVVEIVLVFVLAVHLVGCRYSNGEIALVLIFIVSMALSAFYNPIQVVMLNGKIFGLSVLSLLLFSKVRFDAAITRPILVTNVVVTLYQATFGDPWWFVWFMNNYGGSWRGLTNSRPLGLFLSTHASATFTAIFFLSYYRGRFRSAVGFLVLLTTRSFFVLTSYLSQVVWRIVDRLRLGKPVAVLGVVGVFIAFINASTLIDRDLTTISAFFTQREQLGYNAILQQLLSFDAYTWAFTLLPRDSTELAGNFINWAGNEVMYFTILQQGGFLLAAWYVALLFPRIDGLRVFVFVSMMHYGMATTPIVILLLLQAPSLERQRVRIRRRVMPPAPDRIPPGDSLPGPIVPGLTRPATDPGL